MSRPGGIKHRGRDARNAQRREREWLSANIPQRCAVCGKWFVRRADKVCSRECAAKLEEQTKQQKAWSKVNEQHDRARGAGSQNNS
jgi:hypothetical protein